MLTLPIDWLKVNAMDQNINDAARVLGKLGGAVKSKAKTDAARLNARKPRPGRKKKKKPIDSNEAVG